MTTTDIGGHATAADLDSMLADVAEHRRALEGKVDVVAKALYPALWREMTYLRTRVHALEVENRRLRGHGQDDAPTVKLPPVRELPPRRRTFRRRSA